MDLVTKKILPAASLRMTFHRPSRGRETSPSSTICQGLLRVEVLACQPLVAFLFLGAM